MPVGNLFYPEILDGKYGAGNVFVVHGVPEALKVLEPVGFAC